MATQSSYEQIRAIALRGLVLFPLNTIHIDIGRKKSLNALHDAMAGDMTFFTVCQQREFAENPGQYDLHGTGCVVKIKQIMPLPDHTVRVLVDVLCRARLVGIYDDGEMLTAEIERIPEPVVKDSVKAQALLRVAKKAYLNLLNLQGSTGGETRAALEGCSDPGQFADRFAVNVMDSADNKQRILDCVDPLQRLQLICSYMNQESEIIGLEQELTAETQKRLDRSNREYFLREQQKVIEDELGEGDDDAVAYERKLKSVPMNDEAREKVAKELKRFKRAAPQSPEANVMQNYIEYMLELPWGKLSSEVIDIKRARRILDQDHYGLEEVKKRVLEYLAVRSLKDDSKGPILCLAGAPGVGKTSIARSVARALRREFCQVSLGGVHDEAEIRGHRRTYIGAMAGRVITGIKQAGSCNPVFLFDEIDKMATDMRGDPASAMLEVLDPEQNARFVDHYLDAPFDLSKVLFITTANSLDSIPRPLLDRMEVIEVPSYTVEEKLQIAKRHLWKKQLAENAMLPANLKINDAALLCVIEDYTAEAGVRTLEKTLGRIIRKATVERLELDESERKPVSIKPRELQHYLGAAKYTRPEAGKAPEIGVVNGLAWTSVGGVVMPIEVAVLPGKGEIQLTGSLGDVMKESARIALSFVRAHMADDGVTEEFRTSHDLHIHVPEGATPKDGPSAGIAMACAIYSALSGLPARQDVAMTGEISLRGKAMPIGGVREKLMAAYRLGITDLLIPRENVKDLEDIPEDIREKLNITPIDNAMQALNSVLVGKAGAK